MFLDLIVLRLCDTITSALENTLSAGTKVPGMLKYLLTNLHNKGKTLALHFHQIKGFSFLEMLGCSM